MPLIRTHTTSKPGNGMKERKRIPTSFHPLNLNDSLDVFVRKMPPPFYGCGSTRVTQRGVLVVTGSSVSMLMITLPMSKRIWMRGECSSNNK